MIPIEELIPEDFDYWWGGTYKELIESLGHQIVVSKDLGAYQGNSLLLLKGEQGWGYLTFGWGSCSGCDWLEGCSNRNELDELRQTLDSQIRWGSREDTAEFLVSHDWEGDHFYHYDDELGVYKFIVNALSAIIDENEAEK